jgi:hypothetical protein
VDWNEDADRLEEHIRTLERLLGEQPDLSPDARVTGLAALVNAKATLRAIETLEMYTQVIKGDVAEPLASG